MAEALAELAAEARRAAATDGRGALVLSERLDGIYYLPLGNIAQAQLPDHLAAELTLMVETYDVAQEFVVVRVLQNGRTSCVLYRRRGAAALTA